MGLITKGLCKTQMIHLSRLIPAFKPLFFPLTKQAIQQLIQSLVEENSRNPGLLKANNVKKRQEKWLIQALITHQIQ